MARETEFCNHYQAMSDHACCKAGVNYKELTLLVRAKENGGLLAMPCFQRNGKAPPGCDKAVFPTPEEIAERDAELAKRFERMAAARSAIVKHLGGPWKKGMPGRAGSIDCPNCDSGCVNFTRSGYNGHIHARCTTENCCAWME